MMDFGKKPKKGKKAEAEQLMAEVSAHARQGHAEEALSRLSQLLEKRSGEFYAHFFAANTYQVLGDSENAIKQLAFALALDPKFFAIHYLLAKTALADGNLALAEALLDAGWKIRKKGTPKDQQKEVKKSHYALLEDKVEVD